MSAVAQIPGTTECATCYGTATIDQGGAEIECPDCPPSVETWTIVTIWAKHSGQEFTRTREYRAAVLVDAMDQATFDLPDSCYDIIDQYLV